MPELILPGDTVIVTARVTLVITRADGSQRVKLDTESLEWVDGDRCQPIGRT